MALEKKIKGIEVWPGVYQFPVRDDPHVLKEYEAINEEYGRRVNKAIEERNRKIRKAEKKFWNLGITYGGAGSA